MKQIIVTTLVAFIGIIVLAQEAQLSGVSHLKAGHNATNNSTQNNSTQNNTAILNAVLRNLTHLQSQINQLTRIVQQLQNSTHNNSTHNNSTGNGNHNHNSTLVPGHNSTISGQNFTQLLNISLQNTRQLNSLQNSVNYLTGLLVNLTQHLNFTGAGNKTNGVHLHPLHNTTHNRTHPLNFGQLFFN